MASRKKAPAKLDADDFLDVLRSAPADEESYYGMFDDPAMRVGVEEYISTGNIAVDKYIGGGNGWPIGRISVVTAWEHVGKSTLLDQSIAQCQRMGGTAYLIDAEEARDPAYMKALGVNLGGVIRAAHPTPTLEWAFAEIDRAIDAQQALKDRLNKGKKNKKPLMPPPLLIVLDSLPAVPPAVVLENPDDKQPGLAQRIIKRNFARVLTRIADLRIAVVVSNHFYKNIGGMGAENQVFGGSGIRYYAYLHLTLTRIGQIKVGNNIVGHQVKVGAKKNRISGMGGAPAVTGLIYGHGFDNSYALYEWGKKATHPGADQVWIKTGGGWNALHVPGVEDPYRFQKGSFGLGEILTNNPDIYQTMAMAYMEAA